MMSGSRDSDGFSPEQWRCTGAVAGRRVDSPVVSLERNGGRDLRRRSDGLHAIRDIRDVGVVSWQSEFLVGLDHQGVSGQPVVDACDATDYVYFELLFYRISFLADARPRNCWASDRVHESRKRRAQGVILNRYGFDDHNEKLWQRSNLATSVGNNM